MRMRWSLPKYLRYRSRCPDESVITLYFIVINFTNNFR